MLATNATCASNAYPKAIAKAVPNAPAVAQQGSSTLAAAIEGAKPAAESDLFFISVANPKWPGVQLEPDGGLRKEFKYGRDAGNPGREDTVIVPMTIDRLPASTANLLRTRLPAVAASMGASKN